MISLTIILSSVIFILPVALAVATFEVEVGAGGSSGCSPAFIGGVADGDVVNFVFHPGNHTIAQSSSFDTLCGAFESEDEGFSTGSVLVSAGTTVKSFIVPAGILKKPLWFSCGQATDCQSRTMFTINAAQAPDPNAFKAQAFRLQARATGPSDFTSLNSAANTLGLHNPGTFSGSIATAASVQEGPTGTFTDGDVPPSTTPTTPTTNSLGGASGSGSASASASAGKSSGADSTGVGKSVLILGAVFFVLGVPMV